MSISVAAQTDKRRIDNFPMYGQPDIVRPEHLKILDEHFIATAVKTYGSRAKASQAWYEQGEEFLRQNNLDFAMRRYNQSWLLDPNNHQPYWGFGRVLLRRKECDSALQQFAKARELVNDKFQRVAVMSDSGVAYGFCATLIPHENPKERNKYFERANRQFAETTRLNPGYAVAWYRWAQVLLEQKQAKETWEKVRRAQSAGYTVPEDFLVRLRQLMPDPK